MEKNMQQNSRSHVRHKNGFTLLELMVVVAILAIMAAIAAPSYRQMMDRSKVRELGEKWQTSYYAAQKEALRRKDVIAMCGSEDGQTCGKDPQDFSHGWIVFSRSQPTKPINVTTVQTDQISASFNHRSSIDGKDVALFFLRDGRLPVTMSEATLTVKYPDSDSRACAEYTVNQVGNIDIEKGEVVCKK